MLGQKVLEIATVFSFFETFFLILEKEEKHSDTENIEDLSKVQRQNGSNVAQVSLKSHVSKT